MGAWTASNKRLQCFNFRSRGPRISRHPVSGSFRVGTIGIIDDDKVSLSNLQRQVIYPTEQLGEQKVFSATEAIYKLNSNVNVRPYNRRLNAEIAEEIFSEYDVIVDGTDNFETRYIANAAATKTNKPLVSGALSQWEGQVSVFAPIKAVPATLAFFLNHLRKAQC